MQHLEAILVDKAVIDLSGSSLPSEACEFVVFEKPVPLKDFKVDEVGISGIHRKRLIRRIAVACRRKWQYLPAFDSGAFQEVHELESVLSHFADTVLGRQTGYMHKYAAFSHVISPL